MAKITLWKGLIGQTPMRGLLGDRFLRRFTSDLKHRWKHPVSTGQGQNPEDESSSALGPEAFWPMGLRAENHASEENREETAADAAAASTMVPDATDRPNEVELIQQNEVSPNGESPDLEHQ